MIYKLLKYITFASLFAFCASGGVKKDARVVGVEKQNDDLIAKFDLFWNSFKQAVLLSDKNLINDYIDFPLEIAPVNGFVLSCNCDTSSAWMRLTNGNLSVDKDSMMLYFDSVFVDDLKFQISKLTSQEIIQFNVKTRGLKSIKDFLLQNEVIYYTFNCENHACEYENTLMMKFQYYGKENAFKLFDFD